MITYPQQLLAMLMDRAMQAFERTMDQSTPTNRVIFEANMRKQMAQAAQTITNEVEQYTARVRAEALRKAADEWVPGDDDEWLRDEAKKIEGR